MRGRFPLPLLALAALLLPGCASPPPAPAAGFDGGARFTLCDAYSGLREENRTVAADAAALAAWWQRSCPGRPPPEADFTRQRVALYTAQLPSPQHSVRLGGVEAGPPVTVTFERVAPAGTCTQQGLMVHHTAAAVVNTTGEVRVAVRQVQRAC
jgi:hypothetical protein